jgi:hypothetical protein
MARRTDVAFLCLFAVSVLFASAASTRGEAIIGPPLTGAEEPASPDDPLRILVEKAIFTNSRRYLNAGENSPWQISHGVLALRRDFQLKSGNELVNAIDWISDGGRFRGEFWFEATPFGGRAHPYNNFPKHFEGHVNQTLALIAMSNLPLDHQFRVRDGRVLTMADMINHSKLMANTNEETTWTLWFLTTYLDQDEQWTNQRGEGWSMEYLVQLQNRVNVTAAPCGGCHNLFALAYARNAYLRKYARLNGAWLEADQKIQQHTASVQALQNPDGSFSTMFFKGRGFSYRFEERITSSGHNLEWLMMALPQSRLNEDWLRSGVETLARDLINNAMQTVDPGPLYHAVHALVLYRDRIGPKPSTPERPLEFVRAPQPRPVPESPSVPRLTTVEPVPPDAALSPTATQTPHAPKASSVPATISKEPIASPTKVAHALEPTAVAQPRTLNPSENPLPPPPPSRTPGQPADRPSPPPRPKEDDTDLPPLPPNDAKQRVRLPVPVPTGGR